MNLKKNFKKLKKLNFAISHNKNILKYCDSIYSIQNKTIKLLREKENN